MDVKNYTDKKYSFSVERVSDESGTYYVAKVLEFDGCIATGETPEEALQKVREVLGGFIESMIVDGETVPEPM